MHIVKIASVANSMNKNNGIFETSVAKEYIYSSALVLTYFSCDVRLRKKKKKQIIDIVLVRAVCTVGF